MKRVGSFSPGVLFVSLIVSSIGLGFFLYGKKQGRPLQLLAGLALMVYPYFVDRVVWSVGIAALIIGGVWVAVRYGL